MPEGKASPVVVISSKLLKVLAILVGGPLSVLALMSVIGAIVDNGWVRLIGAVVLTIGVPAIVADRVLPDDPDKGKGLVTDVLAVFWLSFAFLYIGLLAPVTRGLMHQEADRLWDADRMWLAKGTYWLSGGTPASATSPDGEVVIASDAGALDGGGATTEVETDANAVAAADADADVPDAPDAGPVTASDKPLEPEEIFKAFAPAVVSIQVSSTSTHHMGGSGTGFVIDAAKGVIVTNHHVIDSASSVRVKLKDGRWARKVELLTQDKDSDLALLRISPADKLVEVELGDSDTVKVGERAISIGNPLGLEHTLTDGLVSARRVIQGQRMIQMSTPISPGNSGGPLFNRGGEVIGVSTATLSAFGQSQNLNLAVPINTMKDLLKDKYPDAKRIGGGGGPDKGTW